MLFSMIQYVLPQVYVVFLTIHSFLKQATSDEFREQYSQDKAYRITDNSLLIFMDLIF